MRGWYEGGESRRRLGGVGAGIRLGCLMGREGVLWKGAPVGVFCRTMAGAWMAADIFWGLQQVVGGISSNSNSGGDGAVCCLQEAGLDGSEACVVGAS